MNPESINLENLAENVPGMIYRFYINNKGEMGFDYVSSKAYEIFEVEVEDFKQNPNLFVEMCHPEEKIQLIKHIEESRHNMASFEWEGRILTRTGKVRWIWAKSKPERRPDTSTIWDGVLMDITEKYQRELELKKINTQLKEAQEKFRNNQAQLIETARLAALGEMAGGVAHEINNPLTVIVINSEKLKRQINDNTEWSLKKDKLLSSVDRIEATANRISKIVNGLKSMSRNGSHDPFEKVVVGKIIDDALSLCLEKARNNDIYIELEKINLDELIVCRPVQIAQVLLNLISNSIQALEEISNSDKLSNKLPDNLTNNKSQLFSDVKPNLFSNTKFDDKMAKWILIEIEKLESQIAIIITDSGPGIPEDLREKIFAPFFTTKDVGQGTGLGLSISRGILESHGGSLVLDISKPHTCFKMLLPRG